MLILFHDRLYPSALRNVPSGTDGFRLLVSKAFGESALKSRGSDDTGVNGLPLMIRSTSIKYVLKASSVMLLLPANVYKTRFKRDAHCRRYRVVSSLRRDDDAYLRRSMSTAALTTITIIFTRRNDVKNRV